MEWRCHEPRPARSPQELTEAGGAPQEPQRQRHPTDTLISDLWPLEMGEKKLL